MEMIFNFAVGIFIAFYMVLSFGLDKHTVKGDVFGAGGFPIALAVLGLVVLGFIVWDGLKNKRKVDIPMFDLKSASGKMLIVSVMILAAYLLLMDVIGFFLATLLFAFGSARAMGYNRLPVLLAFSAALSVVIVVIFGDVFYVPLPRGMGIFRELSYFIY